MPFLGLEVLHRSSVYYQCISTRHLQKYDQFQLDIALDTWSAIAPWICWLVEQLLRLIKSAAGTLSPLTLSFEWINIWDNFADDTESEAYSFWGPER